MSESNLTRFFDELSKFKPTVLDGYPSTLYILAKYLKNRNAKFPVKAVISSSETLYDFQREVIEESFQCQMFDYYALAERVIFTTECGHHSGHHLCMEYGLAEIVGQHNQQLEKGENGRLVGTSLFNYAMPLIRYVTNDMTSIKKDICGCGRELYLVDDVTTKAEDTLTLKDGRLISPSVLTHPFKPLNNIEGSQIIQKKVDEIIIKIVPRQGFNTSDTNHLRREFQARLGNDIQVEFEIIDKLPRSPNGKFRWVISEVPLGI
jgi:phenylacetate-CoA ligase